MKMIWTLSEFSHVVTLTARFFDCFSNEAKDTDTSRYRQRRYVGLTLPTDRPRSSPSKAAVRTGQETQIKRAVTLTRAANRGIDNLKSTVRVLEVRRSKFLRLSTSYSLLHVSKFVNFNFTKEFLSHKDEHAGPATAGDARAVRGGRRQRRQDL